MTSEPPRFAVGKFRSGYDTGEVDDFIVEARRRLAEGPSPGFTEWVTEKRFTTTGFRPGYDMEQVDDYLDRLIAEVREGGEATVAHPPASPPTISSLLDEIEVEGVAAGRPDFPRARLWREGYEPDEVGRFLDGVESRLRRTPHPRLADGIAAQRFATTRRGGLLTGPVDTYLDLLARTARQGRG